MLKFSSEYGTYNTIQIGDEMINRSSDYKGSRCDSMDRQSQSNTLTTSGIVSPDIQIQSTDAVENVHAFEPARLLEMSASGKGFQQLTQPYGHAAVSAESKHMNRGGQRSVQAMRGMQS